MRNRILSTVLAVLLLLSALAVGSFAAGESSAKVTLTVGNASAVAGGVAYLPIYAYAENLGETDTILRSWEVWFDCGVAEIQASDGAHTVLVTSGTPYFYTNVTEKKIGVTSAAGQGIVDNAQLTAFGGVQIATVAFDVPADATEKIDVSIAGVSTVSFDDANVVGYAVKKENITTVAGSITVLAEEPAQGVNDAYVGSEGEKFVVPTTNTAGEQVITITKVQSGRNMVAAYTGKYASFYVPAAIESIQDGAINADFTGAEFILKNTQYDAITANAIKTLLSSETYPDNYTATMYYHKVANGTDTTFASLTAVMPTIEQDPALGYYYANILAAPSIEVKTEGETRTMTVVGKIAVDDLIYTGLTIEVKLANGKVIRNATPGTIVGRTVNGATVDGGVYYYAIAITGIPADAVLEGATAVMYGTTPDATGNLITVVSDTATYKEA